MNSICSLSIKNKAYIITFVDRATRCIIGWAVSFFVSDELLQDTLDELPAYGELAYDTGFHFAMPNKSETYSVEGDNAELRHYLARLGRRSRCFSRSLQALHYAVRLFVYCFNARQFYKRRFPTYPAHLFKFVPILD
jgi:hypothetical protein